MNKFVKDRHDAFVSAVVDDEWIKVKRYAKKNGVPMSKDEKVMKAGIEQQSIDKSAMMYEIYMEGVNMSGE